MLLDNEDYLELLSFGGFGLPYGDIPSAGCLTGTILHNTVTRIIIYELWLIKKSMNKNKILLGITKVKI